MVAKWYRLAATVRRSFRVALTITARCPEPLIGVFPYRLTLLKLDPNDRSHVVERSATSDSVLGLGSGAFFKILFLHCSTVCAARTLAHSAG